VADELGRVPAAIRRGFSATVDARWRSTPEQTSDPLMPRYFFHVVDGTELADQEGTELPDLEHARIQGARLLGTLLADQPAEFWSTAPWLVRVADERGQVLAVIRIEAAQKGGLPPRS
jgi:hypothetical protein